MTRKVSSGLIVLKAAAAILLCLGVAFAVVRAMAQTQSTDSSKSPNSATPGNLVVVETEVREKTIRFGDELVVLVTLQNKGTKPIRIPPAALVLNNERWVQGGGSGSGLGEFPLVPTGADGKEEITLQPGESVALNGASAGLGAHSTGSMRAEFVIKTEDEDLRKELGKQEPFTVSYYVAPSALMTAAWAAKTAEDLERLRPQVRDLLLRASRPGDSPAFYVFHTLDRLGCRTLPLLESVMADSDPAVREQAIHALHRAPLGANNLNSYLDQLGKEEEGRAWAASVERCGEKYDQDMRQAIRLAIAALADPAAPVRIAAVAVLTRRASYESSLRRGMVNNPRRREQMDEREKQMYDSVGVVDPALPLIKKLASDSDAGVRAEAQKFLSNFASQPGVVGDVVVALGDADAEVRKQALKALRSSHEPPSIATIEKAFASTKGDVALGLVELMFEREDSDLATRLTPGFEERSAAERLMILTAIAGHTDDAAFKLVISGLKDGDAVVRRVAWMRLVGFPTDKARSVIKADSSLAAGGAGAAAQRELDSRTLFPFLGNRAGSAAEAGFPSVQGTGPVVSPDGKWVAYVETGWGHPGGSGGLGRSNLLSITHVVLRDGSLDRVVSDMFMVGWMSDSRHLGSARDGFATIVNLNGKTIAEFGDPLDKPYTGGGFRGEVWPTGEIRHQMGVRMPHSKIFQRGQDPNAIFNFDDGEDAAFSPDGKWFGPRKIKDVWEFVDSEGHKIELKIPPDTGYGGDRAIWSPDGKTVVILPVHASNNGGEGTAEESRKASVIDFNGRALRSMIDVDQVPKAGGWDYRQGRCNPWSRDGKRLAFIRGGQVWISDPDGNATQLTFDVWNKVFPAFSPDGTKIAYVTWQFDDRAGYKRLGPTDIWVVDVKTGVAARVTRPDPGRIEGLDWLDNATLIYDRLAPDDRHSTLRTASLK